MLEIRNATFAYDDKILFKKINLKLENGHIYGLIGANGSGKTTLINTLSSLYLFNEGDILFNDKADCSYLDRYICLNDDYFYGMSNMKRLIKYYLKYKKVSFDYKKYHQLQSIFNLDDTKLLSTFSFGMRRLAVLIIILSFDFKIIILDEFLEGLDITNRTLIKKELLAYSNDDNLIMITSHKTSDISSICDEIILINGDIIQSNLDDYKNSYKLYQVVLDKGYPKSYFINIGLDLKSFKSFENIHWLGISNDLQQIDLVNSLDYLDLNNVNSSLEEVIFNEFKR